MDKIQQQTMRTITFDSLPASRHFSSMPNDFEGFKWVDVAYITPALSSSFGLDNIDSWYCNVGNIVTDLDGQLKIQYKAMKKFHLQSLKIVSFKGEDLVLIGKRADSDMDDVKILKMNGKTTPQKVKLDWFNLVSLSLTTRTKCKDVTDYSIGLVSFSLYTIDNQ